MASLDFTNEANETTGELQGEIDLLKSIPDDKLKELLPERTNQEELKALIAAVNQETEKNKKEAVLNERLGKASGVVKDLVGKLISGATKFI